MSIKLRGADSDLIKWDFAPFKPGKIFYIPQLTNKPKLKKGKFKISAPKRVTFTPLIVDLTRIYPSYTPALSHCAGGVSLAVEDRTIIEIEINKSLSRNLLVHVNNERRRLLVKHAIKLFQRVTNLNFACKVNIFENYEKIHVGIGSSLSIFSSIIYSLNTLFGKPLDEMEVIKFIMLNYAENYNSKLLMPTLFSGVGIWSIVKGGINVIGGDFTLILHKRIPSYWRGFLLVPKDISIPFEYKKSPEISYINIIRFSERFDASKTAYWMLMKFIPALIKNDLKAMGKLIWYSSISTIKALLPILKLKHYSFFEIMEKLHLGHKFEVVSLTSAGPGIYVLYDGRNKNYQEVKNILYKEGISKQYKVMPLNPTNRGIMLKVL